MSKKYSIPDAPSDLSAESVALWLSLHGRLKFNESETELLRAGLRWRDRLHEALAILAKEGPTLKKGKLMPRKHPALEAARIASGQFLQIWKALGLREDALPPAPGRPQGT